MKRALGWMLGSVGLVACEVSPVDVVADGRRTSVDAGRDVTVTVKEACLPKGKNTDPLSYPPCACAKGGAARCVPGAEIPSALASQLETCSGGACVPESIIASGGAAPKTCASPFGDGRCVSLCVPAVADKASALDRGKGDVCANDERCVPCTNPLDGTSTGVCEIESAKQTESCDDAAPAPPTPSTPVTTSDAGPTAPPKALTACCENHGRCVPKALVPADAQDALGDDDETCAEDQELCVPNELIAPTTPPRACTVTFPFIGGGYQGVCVSDCFETIVPSGDCPGDLVCAPKQ